MLRDRVWIALAAVWLCAALLSAAVQTRKGVSASVRFHHVHVAVGDPGEALTRLSAALNGTRTILQGHGVAVRLGAEYVVLDRERNASGPRRSPNAMDFYLEAVDWFKRHGIETEPPSFAATRVGASALPGRVNAVAFSSDDFGAAVEEVRRGGSMPFEHSDDAARYRLPSRAIVELIADTDRPDAFWCPMHPDVRTPGPAKCPICGMMLVAIPPPRIGEYTLDVAATPSPDGGVSALRIVVREPDTGNPVSAFSTVHEKLFHLFVLSRDLAYFAHVHPEQDADGSFRIAQALPPGEYVLIADFVPTSGTPQMVQRVLATSGYRGPLFESVSLAPGPGEQTVDGLRVTLDPGVGDAVRPSTLRFTFSDAQTGEAVRDLQPYLGASAHLLIVSPDLTTAIHAHPDGPPVAGPVVAFGPVFPKPGVYKLWVQVRRRGAVVTAPFVIEVK